MLFNRMDFCKFESAGEQNMQNYFEVKGERDSVLFWWMSQMGLVLKFRDTTIAIDYYATPDESRLEISKDAG